MEARYTRNIGALTKEQFEALQSKRVCVIGCGGLGGYVIEELLRVGVGKITAIDYDVFDYSNLNRQILSTSETIGTLKSEAAKNRAAIVNSSVEFISICEKFKAANGEKIISGHDLVIYALDNISVRLELSSICKELNIPIIHGAIEEWSVQVSLILPNSNAMEELYGNLENSSNEVPPSSLCPTVATCASLQVAEAIKYLSGIESSLNGILLHFDLLTMEMEKIEL